MESYRAQIRDLVGMAKFMQEGHRDGFKEFDVWLDAVETAAYQQGYEDGTALANVTKSVREVIEGNDHYDD